MKYIILAGEEKSLADRRLTGAFSGWIGGECGGASVLGGGFSGGDGIMLAQAQNIDHMAASDGVIVFRESFDEKIRIGKGVHCSAVVGAENESAVRLLSKLDIQTVTCGLSGKDTVTITSFTGDTAMLALQRSVATCSGKLIQPFEVPIKLGNVFDRYVIMSLFAAKLLAGERLEK